MQPVGELDEEAPRVVHLEPQQPAQRRQLRHVHAQNLPFPILALHRDALASPSLRLPQDLRQFSERGDVRHQLGHKGTKLRLHAVEFAVGVIDDVVKDARDDRVDVFPPRHVRGEHRGEYDGGFDRVRDVGFAAPVETGRAMLSLGKRRRPNNLASEKTG